MYCLYPQLHSTYCKVKQNDILSINDKPGQSNQCQTLWVKFKSQVVQFSNCMTNLDILRTNFQPFPAVKTSQWNLLSKCFVQMSHQNVSLNCLFKMSHQMSHQNVFKMSHQNVFKMSHQNFSSKCLIKISHENVSSNFLIKMFHQNASSNVTGPADFLSAQSHTELRLTDLHNSDYLNIHYMIFRWATYKKLLQYT